MLLWLVLLFGMVQPVSAQNSTAPAQSSPDDINGLISQLNDPAARAKLTAQLQLLQKAQAASAPVTPPLETLGGTMLGLFQSHIASFASETNELTHAFGDFPKVFGIIAHHWQNPDDRMEWERIAASLLLVFSTSFVAAQLVQALLKPVRKALEARTHPAYFYRLFVAVQRFVLLLLPVGAFAASAYGIMAAMDQTLVLGALLGTVDATITFMLMLALGKFVIAPNHPALRLIPSIGNYGAAFLYKWGRRLSAVCIYAWFTLETIEFLGLPHATERALLKFAALLIALLLIALVLQNRKPVRNWIRSDHTGRFHLKNITSLSSARYYFSGVWHIMAVAFIVVTYLTWTFNLEGGPQYILHAAGGTFAAYLAARLLIVLVDQAVDHGIGYTQGLGKRLPRVQSRAGRYLPILRGAIHWLILIGFILTCMHVWGLDSLSWLNLHNRVVQRSLSIAIVVAVAIVAWECIAVTIEHILVAKGGSPIDRSARMRTLLPLARNFSLIIIIAIAGIIILGEIGIDTRPLLAGAGVIGVALGFGSQTLVKDVITGMFILFENTIAIGDIVDLGKSHVGVVESLSIRTLRIRDGNGAIHTVPFSDVASIINMSRDHSIYVFDLIVNYAEDTDRIVEILRDLGAELLADKAYRDFILMPLDIWGVDGFVDTGMNIKAALKTKPAQQWAVVREFNRRLKQRFDAAGIRPPMHRREIFKAPDIGSNAASDP